MFHRPRTTDSRNHSSRFFAYGTPTTAKGRGGGLSSSSFSTSTLAAKHQVVKKLAVAGCILLLMIVAATLMSPHRLLQQSSSPLQQQDPSSLPNLLLTNAYDATTTAAAALTSPELHHQQQQNRQLSGGTQQQQQQQQQRQRGYDVSCPHPCIVEYNTETNEAVQLEPMTYDDDDGYVPEGTPRLRDLPLHVRVKLASSTPLEDQSEDDEGCQYINPRHNLFFPTGNLIHEIDQTAIDVIFINCGGARCAFYFPDSGGSDHQAELDQEQDDSIERRIVLKTQKWKKAFEEKRWEKARKDGLIMEQATQSPYVMDVFALTGTSQLLEYSSRGALHDHIKMARQHNGGQDDMDPIDKLKILIHIASAVSAIHNHTTVAISHGDICCHQFLWKDGYYKLNDFHLSTFLRQDSKTKELCLGSNSVANHEMLWRAPEENDRQPLDQQKVDVYMMGFAMYYVYTKNWLYEGIPHEEALELLHTNHTASTFPSHLDTQTIPANAVMQSAIEQCWRYNPHDRPSAMFVRDYLLRGLTTILRQEEEEEEEGNRRQEATTTRRIIDVHDDVLRVEIPPLPNGHRFTGSSMDNANNSPTRKPPKYIRYRENKDTTSSAKVKR